MATLLSSHVSVTEAHQPDSFRITVVADPGHRPDLELRLAEPESETVPSVRPKIRVFSTR